MKNVNWRNVGKALVFLLCIIWIIYNFYMMIFKFASWTYLGFFSFMFVTGVAGSIYMDFDEQLKKMSSGRNTRHHKRYNYHNISK